MEYVCPECNYVMPVIDRDDRGYQDLIVITTYHCYKCKITWIDYPAVDNLPNGDFYINDEVPMKFTHGPIFESISFIECCRLYKLKAFL